jgi:hypothetical protein
MAELDWTDVTNSLAAASLARGVTTGVTAPNGGSNFVFAWRSLVGGTSGAHALRNDVANFNPIPGNNGGFIECALLRGAGSSATGHSVMAFFQAQSDDVAAGEAYLLGLSNGDPGNIVLRKGTIQGGLPESAIGVDGVLRRSSATVAQGEWVHLRLEVNVQPAGDVLLDVYQNDLTTNPVTAPVWVAVDGMSTYTDDALGINTGTPGLQAGGRSGIAYQISTSGVYAAADHVAIGRTV